MKGMLEESRRIVAIRSTPAEGNDELISYLSALMVGRGFEVKVQQVTHAIESIARRQSNIIGIVGDPLVDRKIKKGLLLLSHLDTVDPGIISDWTETGENPYALTQNGEKLYGLGVADSKLDFLCKFLAALRFRDKKLKMPIYLVGTCGMEQGMLGTRYLIKSQALNPKHVLVGTPTNLNIVRLHKSSALLKVSMNYQVVERDSKGYNRRVDLRSRGVASHSAYPGTGRNAILQMIDFFKTAVESQFDFQFIRMEGGIQSSQSPSEAMAQFCLTPYQFEDFKRFFREVIQKKFEMNAFSADFGGLGEAGILFLPKEVILCLTGVLGAAEELVRDLDSQQDTRFDPPSATLEVTQILQKETQMEIFFDLRLLPDQNAADFEGRFQQKIQRVASGYPLLNVSLTRERMNPALTVSEDHSWYRACQEIARDLSLPQGGGMTSVTTEAGLFQEMAVDVLAFGAGAAKSNIHGPNEWVNLTEIQRSVQFYEKVIERVCL